MDTNQLPEVIEVIRTIKYLCEPASSPWITVATALGGVIVGGLLTFYSNFFLERNKRLHERKVVTTALVSEIQAILTIIEHRKYVEHMKAIFLRLQNQQGAMAHYKVRVPDHYSRVYQANLGRLGLLNSKLAAKIVEFHQLTDAIVQDITPGGEIAERGGGTEAFRQMLLLSERAVAIGNEIIRDVRN